MLQPHEVFSAQCDTFVSELLHLLRFGSISAQANHAADIRACAEWIAGHLTASGFQAEVAETGGHPVVVADNAVDAPVTLLFYGHYDVQPAGDESLWHSAPFEPTIREGAIFARGSADDKGPVMAQLTAMRCWSQSGLVWPIRIKFLLEGEEEIGSPNLPAFVKANRQRLACDYVVLSDSSKQTATTPALAISSRGLLYKQVTLDGPKQDLHSGQHGGAVENPANALARIIAALHDEQRRVTIPGFYADVVDLPPMDRIELNSHAASDADILRSTGCSALVGEQGYTTAERSKIRPTLDVNGIVSGYTGQGSSTIIPASAMAKISMRLVAHQDPDRISRAFDEHLRSLCPPTVKLSIQTLSACSAYQAPSDSHGVRVARQALEQAYGTPAVLAREGGTLPILPLFKQELNADSLLVGITDPDCNLHGPNEFIHLRDFEAGIRCILMMIEQMG